MAKEKPSKIGRPEVTIDWVEVERLLEIGCSGVEIARYLGIDTKTLYNRCQSDNNYSFSVLNQKKRATNHIKVRQVLFNAVMNAEFDPKYLPALIFYAKARLKMSDKPEEKKNSLQDVQITIVDASEDSTQE